MIPVSTDFISALQSPIKILHIKLEIYDSNMTYITEITKQVSQQDLGQVSIDSTRAIRRSFNFTLDNSDGRFTWNDDALIWIDKRVKLYIGLKLSNGTIEFIPQGVYILTQPQDGNVIGQGKFCTLVGMDKAFLMVDKLGKFINQTTIAKNASISNTIKTIASGIGETMFNFDTVTDVTPYEITFDMQSSRWEAIKTLATMAKCDIYYDVNGFLRLKKIDLNEIESMPIAWTFNANDKTEKFYAGNVRKMGEPVNDVFVLGGGSTTGIVSYRLTVTEGNPIWVDSPYSVEKIGYWTEFWNNGNADVALVTTDDCKFRAKYQLMQSLGFPEELDINYSPLYMLDVNDCVEIIDDNTSGKFLIQTISLPINPSLMTSHCLRYKRVLTDWNSF